MPDRADVRWSSWAAETSGKLEGIAPDSYRLRVSAQGRDAGHQGEFAEAVVDEYVLELWPAGRADDAIIRVGSENARYGTASLARVGEACMPWRMDDLALSVAVGHRA